MTTSPREQLITADEFFDTSDDGRFYDLVRGRVVEVTALSPTSSMVSARMSIRAGSFVEQHGLGLCGDAQFGAWLFSDPDTVRAPDACFVSRERYADTGFPHRGYWRGGMDLAIEVLSPTDRWAKVQEKIQEYLAAGIRLIWVLDPYERRTTVHRLDGTVNVLGEDGVLDGEDVLPGFTLPLSEVWV